MTSPEASLRSRRVTRMGPSASAHYRAARPSSPERRVSVSSRREPRRAIDPNRSRRRPARRDALLDRRSVHGRCKARASTRRRRDRRDGGRAHPARGRGGNRDARAAARHEGRATAARLADDARLRRLPRALSAAPGDRKLRHAAPRLADARYTFPAEAAFADVRVARRVARDYLDENLRQGITTAAVFCTVHPGSVDALMREAAKRSLRLIAGKVLMDRNAPRALRDTATRGYDESKALIGALARQGAARLRDHAALRGHVVARAARGRRRAVARAPGLLGAVARVGERR